MQRNKKIIKISIIGIVVNVILVIFKSIIGIITNSIAIILDAINNLSDVLSATITIIGTKLSTKKPDKEHPYGHGRIEYFTSVILSIIIIYAGLVALKESIIKIINPVSADYSVIALIIVIVATITKFILGSYVKKQGKILNSNSLIATGIDAINDGFVSLSTLITAIISIIWHISLEGYLGILISIVILKLAIEILKDTANQIIGVRADSGLIDKIKKEIMTHKEVLGVYDITLHNYGHNKTLGSLHIQVDDNTKAKEIHRLTKRIELEIYNKFGIILTTGIYASNDNEKFKELKNDIMNLIKQYKTIKQIHGLYIDEEYKLITFDLVFTFDETNEQNVIKEISSNLKTKYPKYNYYIISDTDISD